MAKIRSRMKPPSLWVFVLVYKGFVLIIYFYLLL